MPSVYLWNRAPFIRLLACFMAGIICQYAVGFDLPLIGAGICISFIFLLIYSFLSTNIKFRYATFSGVCLQFLVFCTGLMVLCLKEMSPDSRRDPGHEPALFSLLSLEEPPEEKTNSYKALASILDMPDNNQDKNTGRIIIYFKKDSLAKTVLPVIETPGIPRSFNFLEIFLYQYP